MMTISHLCDWYHIYQITLKLILFGKRIKNRLPISGHLYLLLLFLMRMALKKLRLAMCDSKIISRHYGIHGY